MAQGDDLAASQSTPWTKLALAQTPLPTRLVANRYEAVGLYNPGGVSKVPLPLPQTKFPTPWEQPELPAAVV